MTAVGAYFLSWEDIPIRKKIEIYKGLGFESVCLSMSGIKHSKENAMTLELANEYRLSVENVHLTGNATTLVWYDGSEGDDIVERYCNEIALCSSAGVRIGITHVTWGSKGGVPPLTPLAIERFKKIIDCAEKHNFILALENSVFPEHLRYVMCELSASPNVGFCYDTGHRYCFTPHDDWITEYGAKTVAMHLDDNDGNNDLHLIPFDGIAPWDEIKNDLKKTDIYNHFITMEVKGRIHKDMPGKSAEEIYNSLSRIAIRDDGRLVQIYDGGFDIYKNLSYEEYMARVYQAGKRLI